MCLRGNKIAPLRHAGLDLLGTCAEGVQFYRPSHIYVAIPYCTIFSILAYYVPPQWGFLWLLLVVFQKESLKKQQELRVYHIGKNRFKKWHVFIHTYWELLFLYNSIYLYSDLKKIETT